MKIELDTQDIIESVIESTHCADDFVNALINDTEWLNNYSADRLHDEIIAKIDTKELTTAIVDNIASDLVQECPSWSEIVDMAVNKVADKLVKDITQSDSLKITIEKK